MLWNSQSVTSEASRANERMQVLERAFPYLSLQLCSDLSRVLLTLGPQASRVQCQLLGAVQASHKWAGPWGRGGGRSCCCHADNRLPTHTHTFSTVSKADTHTMWAAACLPSRLEQRLAVASLGFRRPPPANAPVRTHASVHPGSYTQHKRKTRHEQVVCPSVPLPHAHDHRTPA
jgi:hypothetical protein